MCSCADEMNHERLTAQDRATAHDLRNLFGIVASAARLLSETADREKQASIISALQQSALRGGAICDTMISKALVPLSSPLDEDFDGAVNDALPLVRPLIGEGVSLISDLRAAQVASPLAGQDIETILVELVGNAVRHSEGATRIMVRSRYAAGRAWLIVADDGRGRLDRVRTIHHGYGLLRIDLLVRRAGGDLQLRRQKGGNIIAGISFPILGESRLGPRKIAQSPAKEKDRENRQPIAA